MNIKRLCSVIFLFLLCGCAFSGAVKSHYLLHETIVEENWSSDYEVYLNCPDELKSISFSPLVPLPPIIPVGFMSEERSLVIVHTPHSVYATAKILDKNNKEVDISIDIEKWTGSKYGKSDKIIWTFSVNSSCKDLGGNILCLEVVDSTDEKSTVKYDLKYVPGALSTGAGYISA
ncbi:hypothetical protein [Shewanella youngdeokensis]|uniref:Lipoprotein n=1 Tax=Shewanella youngdeokensis TaxID=2999068 RepID=A0ABZ0JU19_9GAMM|nr:hypothetical protein RGE70_10455 [Shewanella sp. DAU334]